jgi:hypothetical protein
VLKHVEQVAAFEVEDEVLEADAGPPEFRFHI